MWMDPADQHEMLLEEISSRTPDSFELSGIEVYAQHGLVLMRDYRAFHDVAAAIQANRLHLTDSGEPYYISSLRSGTWTFVLLGDPHEFFLRHAREYHIIGKN
jgi:hypothetical protein